MISSIDQMVAALENTAVLSTDPVDEPFFNATSVIHTGQCGCPHINIDSELLAVVFELCGPTHLAQTFNVHPHTIRRCILEQGLAEPGEPVYVDYEQPDGSITHVFCSSTGALSDLSDQELDDIVLYILEAFPGFGRRMIDGHLKFLGHRIPCSQIQASYARVHGAPPTGFGPRRIERCIYSVPGPNSLWHHDGQHGTR